MPAIKVRRLTFHGHDNCLGQFYSSLLPQPFVWRRQCHSCPPRGVKKALREPERIGLCHVRRYANKKRTWQEPVLRQTRLMDGLGLAERGRSLIPVQQQVTLRTCLFLSVVGKERREAVDREWHGGVRHLRLAWNLMHE